MPSCIISTQSGLHNSLSKIIPTQPNQVYTSVFNIIGIYTFVYQCLLIPGGRSANNIPAWPFVVLSYGLGAFALLPYMALWSPVPDMKLPPKPEELEGWNRLPMKGAETKVCVRV